MGVEEWLSLMLCINRQEVGTRSIVQVGLVGDTNQRKREMKISWASGPYQEKNLKWLSKQRFPWFSSQTQSGGSNAPLNTTIH
ncbi:unnamed protein product [Sphenostylis stenocarpa]|uniref:Uncharacterized protein n=1 Tax=Sphenostylis stenocarpa TaxID=92480 RepID=A0AA86SZK2_9FABA|nr:unnamed protein product [Sphenostylis stenocarpa]